MNGLQVSQRIGRSLYIYKIWSSSSLAVSFLGFASFFPEVVTDCLSLVLQALQTVDFFGGFSLIVRHGLWLSLRLKALKTGNTFCYSLLTCVSLSPVSAYFGVLSILSRWVQWVLLSHQTGHRSLPKCFRLCFF